MRPWPGLRRLSCDSTAVDAQPATSAAMATAMVLCDRPNRCPLHVLSRRRAGDQGRDARPFVSRDQSGYARTPRTQLQREPASAKLKVVRDRAFRGLRALPLLDISAIRTLLTLTPLTN